MKRTPAPNKTIRLRDGTGYRRGPCEFWYDPSIKLWVAHDTDSLDTLGYETDRPLIEWLIDDYTALRARRLAA